MILQQFKKSVITIIIFVLALPAFSTAPHLTLEQIKNPPPKIIRICCAFGANIGYAGIPFAKRNDITSVDAIGPHKYMGDSRENNGLVYTHRGGFLDLGHLRDCADWTAYLYNLIQACKEDSSLSSIHLGFEGGSKSLLLKLPKELCDDEVAELAAKIAYDESVWHEISTWFGARYVPLLPERYSSFSPEDIYSNLMGTHLAIQAIESDMDYDEAMTFYLNKMLKDLDVVSTWDDTFNALEKVNKLWFDGDKRFPNKKVTIKRFLDTESALSPWLIPEDKGVYTPYVLNKPDKSYSDYYELQIKLNYHFPVKSMFADLNDRIITQKDFPVMINRIHYDLNKLEQKEEKRELKSEERKEKRFNDKIGSNL